MGGQITYSNFPSLAKFSVILGVGATILLYVNTARSELLFNSHVISSTAQQAESIAAVDLNNDGHLDLVTASLIDDQVTWYQNNGAVPPSFTPHVLSLDPDGPGTQEGWADGAELVTAADLNKDTFVDILSMSAIDRKLAWYQNSGANPPAFSPQVINNLGSGKSLFAVDIDKDGDMDLIHLPGVYLNDGKSSPGFTLVPFPGSPGLILDSSDLDSDSDLDVVYCRQWASGYEYGWYENVSGATIQFATHAFDTSYFYATALKAGDLDGDGDGDIVASQFLTNSYWYENTGGSPSVFVRRAIPTYSFAYAADFADLDMDGDTDILWGNNLTWYENNGAHPPAFTQRFFSPRIGLSFKDIRAADLDGDGDKDVLVAEALSAGFYWLENLLLPGSGPTPTPAPTATPTSTVSGMGRSYWDTR